MAERQLSDAIAVEYRGRIPGVTRVVQREQHQVSRTVKQAGVSVGKYSSSPVHHRRAANEAEPSDIRDELSVV